MHRFSLRTIFILTAAVAVVCAIAISFPPRDLRNEVEKIAEKAPSFQDNELIGKYAGRHDLLTINSDGTYTHIMPAECMEGHDFVDTGKWLLDRNILNFYPAKAISEGALRWAFVTRKEDGIALIPDYLSSSYLDFPWRTSETGYRESPFLRRVEIDLYTPRAAW